MLNRQTPKNGDPVAAFAVAQSDYRAGSASRPTAGASPTAKTPPATGHRLVRDVMTRQVLCVSPEQPLADVASLMSNKDVDRVPVVSEGRLVGFLTRGDIVRKLLGS